jgi:hypothetical protein
VDFSPAFIWLLRDFQLRLESNGRRISPAEYLEEALLPVKGGEADIANRNQVRLAGSACLQLSQNDGGAGVQAGLQQCSIAVGGVAESAGCWVAAAVKLRPLCSSSAGSACVGIMRHVKSSGTGLPGRQHPLHWCHARIVEHRALRALSCKQQQWHQAGGDSCCICRDSCCVVVSSHVMVNN